MDLNFEPQMELYFYNAVNYSVQQLIPRVRRKRLRLHSIYSAVNEKVSTFEGFSFRFEWVNVKKKVNLPLSCFMSPFADNPTCSEQYRPCCSCYTQYTHYCRSPNVFFLFFATGIFVNLKTSENNEV